MYKNNLSMMPFEDVNERYMAPNVEVVECNVECGFVMSNLEDPEENDVMDW